MGTLSPTLQADGLKRSPLPPDTVERRPCDGCGYMIRGGSVCDDCIEYGPPRDWLWEYDPATDSHEKVARPWREVPTPWWRVVPSVIADIRKVGFGEWWFAQRLGRRWFGINYDGDE